MHTSSILKQFDWITTFFVYAVSKIIKFGFEKMIHIFLGYNVTYIERGVVSVDKNKEQRRLSDELKKDLK